MQKIYIDLLDLSVEKIIQFLQEIGEKKFRVIQLLRWIHQKGEFDFMKMNDLSISFRKKLTEKFQIQSLPILSKIVSIDGTCKWLLDIENNNAIEMIYIPENTRGTLCVSSQAGCAINCKFCFTGKQGFSRNLTTREIISQLWLAEHSMRNNPECIKRINQTKEDLIKEHQNRVISNVVFMGMGEPLLNYEAVTNAIRIMLDDRAYGLSKRHITISTSGVVPMIDRLAKDLPVSLAVSLHAPNDQLRNELVPLNKKYPLKDLIAACIRYLPYAPRNFLTFEYCMLNNINDSTDHAKELIHLLKDIPCKFNLIPFNSFPNSGLSRSKNIDIFSKCLSDAGFFTTIRKTRGQNVFGSCGQLAGKIQNITTLRTYEK